MTQTSVVIHGTGSGFVAEIATEQHRFKADEPLSAGGSDTGPLPTSCFLRLWRMHRHDSHDVCQTEKFAARRNCGATTTNSRSHAEDCFRVPNGAKRRVSWTGSTAKLN